MDNSRPDFVGGSRWVRRRIASHDYARFTPRWSTITQTSPIAGGRTTS